MSGRTTFTPKVVEALETIRKSRNSVAMAPYIREAFRELDAAGVFEEVDRWERLNGWIPLPPGVVGTQIRHRKIVGSGVRLGGGEPKVIITETAEWVVYAVYSGGLQNRFICEKAVPRTEFDEEFERKE